MRAGTHGGTFGKHQTGAARERARAEAPSGHAQRRRVRAGTQRITFGPPQGAPRASGHARGGGAPLHRNFGVSGAEVELVLLATQEMWKALPAFRIARRRAS